MNTQTLTSFGTTVPVRATASHEPLPLGRLLRAYLAEVRYDMLSALRTPAFAFPMIAIPVAIYVLFGVFIAGNGSGESEYGPAIANYLFAGFCVIGTIMTGIFSGIGLAIERDGNLLKLKRAMPVPPGAVIIAKVGMAMGVAAISVTLVAIAALVAGKLTISVWQVLIIWATLIVGTIPFCAIGLAIGAYTSGRASPAFGNLFFLPMMWLSGIMIPLPDSLERWVVIWPSFHLDQLALNLAGVEQFSFISPALAAAVLVGVTVLFGGLAIRRLARVG